MTYLLDTNWLVSFLNGRAEAVELLEKRSLEGISVSIIVCGEVYEGFQQDHSSESRLVQFDKFLETSRSDNAGSRHCPSLRRPTLVASQPRADDP
jgi:predicted nucleic acid-binding protein